MSTRPEQCNPAGAAVLFRRAGLNDVREVAAWITTPRECELWAGPRLPFPPDPDLLPADIDLFNADSVAMLEGGRLIAFGQVLYMDGVRAHLARIIVAPDRRGCGHGRALVDELLRRAQRQGYGLVSLYVDRDNPRALSLYAGFGFRQAQRPPGELASARTLYLQIPAPPETE